MKTIFTIWTQPRKTFEYLDTNEDPVLKNNLDILFYLGSLALVLPQIPQIALKYNALNGHSVILVIFLCLIVSLFVAFLVALIVKYVHSFMLWIIGKALQGKASKAQVQLVVAYAMIPGLVSMFISCVLIIIALFRNDIAIIGYQNPLTLFLIWIFGTRTLIYGLARFNRFSYGYALLNFIVSVTLVQGIMLSIKYMIN